MNGIKPGVLTRIVSLVPPASTRHTLNLPLSESRPAAALPAEPPPTTMISNSSILTPLKVRFNRTIKFGNRYSAGVTAFCWRSFQRALMLSDVSRLPSWLQPGGRHK